IAGLADGWHHLAAVGEGGVTRFYIDGVEVGAAPVQSRSDVQVIGNYGGGGQSFGTIDELAIYQAALTPATIRARYALGQAGGDYAGAVLGTAGLAAYYRFGEPAGTATAVDEVATPYGFEGVRYIPGPSLSPGSNGDWIRYSYVQAAPIGGLLYNLGAWEAVPPTAWRWVGGASPTARDAVL